MRLSKKLIQIIFIMILMNIATAIPVFSASKEVELYPSFYEFYEKKSHYEISDDNFLVEEELEPTGQLILRGVIKDDNQKDGVPSYIVDGDAISFSYYSDAVVIETDEEGEVYDDTDPNEDDDTVLYVIDDNSKDIDDFSLDSNIESGALVVQSSFDGKKWITDEVKTDIFNDEVRFDNFYKPNDIQLVNGCYFRIILAYKMSVESNHRKVLFFNVRDHFNMKCAEVYKCYLHTDNKPLTLVKPEDGKRIGELKKAELNKGYSGSIPIVEIDDPQYSKPIGDFYIGGFTREETEVKNKEEIPVFLKDVDNRVTLWFELNDDINRINNNENLSVTEDNGGYDSYFHTDRKNFERGALIVRYTNVNGRPDETVVYTNFLAACDTTRANTMINLFEEGDYEVALDYKIKNTPRKVGSLAIVPEYSDYQIFFKFEIRNSNCMVYPFDLKTGSELVAYDLAPEGFRLDLAKSKYLNIQISRANIIEEQDGTLKESTRFDVATKDGAEYTDEGIYRFTVSNKYTKESVTSELFVGESKYIKALSRNNPHTLDSINEQLKQGAFIENDGSIKMPTPTDTEKEDAEAVSSEEPTEMKADGSDISQTAPVASSEENASEDGISEKEESEETSKSVPALPLTIIGILGAGGAGVYCYKKKRK